MRAFQTSHDTGNEGNHGYPMWNFAVADQHPRESFLKQVLPTDVGWEPSGMQPGDSLQSQQVILGDHIQRERRLGRSDNSCINERGYFWHAS
jgi:hypothetical protein